MDDNKRIQIDEYTLQYYRINAPIVIQHLFNAFTIIIGDYIESLETECINICPAKKTICIQVCNDLRREYLSNILTVLKRKEIELRDLLLIPGHVLLPEDKCFSKKYTEDEVNGLKKEIEDLEKLYLEKKAKKAQYEKELEDLAKLTLINDQIQEAISKVEELCKKENSKLNTLTERYDNAASLLMKELKCDVDMLRFGGKKKVSKDN